MKHRLFLPFALLGALAVACSAGATARPAHSSDSKASAGEVAALQQAYAALHQADHDYQGHRFKAMHAVAAACRALGASETGDGSGQEPQGESDAQLRKAQELLQGISGSAGKKSRRAAGHIHRAISEISTALSIR